MKQSKNNSKYFPEINPCTYGQLIYNKGGTNMQWRKESTTDAGRSTGQPQARVKLDHGISQARILVKVKC